MQNLKVSLLDNDFVIHAKADLTGGENKNDIMRLIRHLDEDFIPGEGAYLEIDGFGSRRTRYVISRVEA